MLSGKKVVIGVTGGIAVYKACDIISMLKKANAQVKVIMTKNSTEFVSPLTFETLSQNKVILNTFSRQEDYNVEHISLAKWADIFVVAPATANVIAKLASGIADDMLSTTLLAVKCPIIICPAMNTNMYKNAIVEENILKLKNNGYIFVNAEEGRLACGDSGEGKLASINIIFNKINEILLPKQDFKGKKILVTAGATIEHIDPIRFISNKSSGKMGMALCRACALRGGEVTLVSSNISIPIDSGVKNVYSVNSTEDMLICIEKIKIEYDYIIMAAAPADYTPINISENKIKGDNITLNLKKTADIAKTIASKDKTFKLIVFAAESTNLIEYAKEKLKSKNADLIVANDVSIEGAGFMCDTNIVTIIDKDGVKENLPIMQKIEVANIILDYALRLK